MKALTSWPEWLWVMRHLGERVVGLIRDSAINCRGGLAQRFWGRCPERCEEGDY